MKFEIDAVTSTVEILAAKDFTGVPITVAVPTGSDADPVVKAGTPLTSAGASTTGTGAVGVLLYDVDTSANPNGTVVVAGVIDEKKAQEYSGVTYAAALKTALPAVIFRDNIGVTSGG